LAGGISDSELQEERTLAQLGKAIKSFAPDTDCAAAANDLYGNYCLARLLARSKRKEGTATQTSVARQLKQIESGAATLARRLREADKNVFDAWATASDDDSTGNPYEAAKQDWLQLKVLLQDTHKRAGVAAQTAEKVLKLWRQVGKKGRPKDRIADFMSVVVADTDEALSGKTAARSVDRVTGTPDGEVHDFLGEAFKVLGVKASADEANRRLQAHLKKRRA
jgi:uncharacterized protein YicC (UPF0701 family)